MVFKGRLKGRVILTWSLRVHCSVQMSVIRLRACLAISSRNMLHRDRLRSPIWCLCMSEKQKANVFSYSNFAHISLSLSFNILLSTFINPPTPHSVFLSRLQGVEGIQQLVSPQNKNTLQFNNLYSSIKEEWTSEISVFVLHLLHMKSHQVGCPTWTWDSAKATATLILPQAPVLLL